MIRFLLILSFICFAQLAVFAEDVDFWDEPVKIDNAAKSQEQAVTDQEFNKVLNLFKKKQTAKEEKKKKKMGTPMNPDIENQPDMKILNNLYDSYPTLMVPVTLVTTDRQKIEPGYYRVMSVKKPEQCFINFYQGNSLIAKVKAVETENDYGQKTLNYVKIITEQDNKAKIIYGDLDCNLETTVEIN